MVIPRCIEVRQPPAVGVQQAARNRSRRAAVARNHRRVNKIIVGCSSIQDHGIQSVDVTENVGIVCGVPVEVVVDTEMVSAEGVPTFNSASASFDLASTSSGQRFMQPNHYNQSVIASVESNLEDIPRSSVHTSGVVDNTVNSGQGPYVYKLAGTNHHKIGSLLPMAGQKSKFAQLYMTESDAKVEHRLRCLGNADDNYGLDPHIVSSLRDMLDEHNEIVKVFRHARDMHKEHEEIGYKIRLLSQRDRTDRNYEPPTCDEIAAIVPGDVGYGDAGRDIIVKHKEGILERIKAPSRERLGRQFLTMREYYAYLIQQRSPDKSTLLRGGRLFQQFIVDAYAIIEEARLRYIREHQKTLRTEMFREVRDVVAVEDLQGSRIGARIILPPSFIPGPRYLFKKYQDAMAICRFHGYPSLFITFTCNPKWPEITDALKAVKGQKPHDRPDIVSRVFRIKLRHLLNDLTKKQIFGKTKAVVYTVEFQKRGLPHVHILLWLDMDHSMTESEVDAIVSAELPNKEKDPIGFAAVSTFMMHSPCGHANRSAKCMKDGRCKKFFPKQFRNSTTFDEDGFPHYRRRQTSDYAVVDRIEVDNRFVVPHNVDLSGPDRVRAVVERADGVPVNEINDYLDCRYLSAYECCWRLFEFPLHHREPAVQRLLVHLPGEHRVYFSDNQPLSSVLERPGVDRTMFTEWFEVNKRCEDARRLFYADFPTEWTWKAKDKTWVARQNRRSIGGLQAMKMKSGGLQAMKTTVDGILYGTFKEACFAMGVLGDDSEWIEAMEEASQIQTGDQLRRLFVMLILDSMVGDPKSFFEKTWTLLAEDISFKLRRSYGMEHFSIPPDHLKNQLLLLLEDEFKKHGHSLEEYNLPLSPRTTTTNLGDKLLDEELNYDKVELEMEHLKMLNSLNEKQMDVYMEIMRSVDNESGGMYFVYGSGGTGKTYLWTTLISALRSVGKIVLAVASSGIASLLLPGGRTTHSRFKIPLDISPTSTCQITKNTQLARLIIRTALIIWDEAPMVHRNCIEALNKTLQDVVSDVDSDSASKPFGGKTIVFGSDFKQILPVIPYGSKSQILNATITSSDLWKECRLLALKTNMRFLRKGMDEDERNQMREFAEWILKIGDGKISAVGLNDDRE
ncbi:DNA helicase PIF1, ATP-dependent [Corchorus olitorius]|uniref:ATP-dependent DNA helicase n=1 Tax=Corchorus olitorius TaxID=93759 RepID=A0A1R3KVY0_9ROSI|nr:DNA helicase PIF1, ATP-dependent [Corchorus olitorius]